MYVVVLRRRPRRVETARSGKNGKEGAWSTHRKTWSSTTATTTDRRRPRRLGFSGHGTTDGNSGMVGQQGEVAGQAGQGLGRGMAATDGELEESGIPFGGCM